MRKLEQHGLRNTSDYNRWATMIQRCSNPNSSEYHRYGARGIKVYEPWVTSFVKYKEYIDTLPRPEGDNLSIDRIDNNGNYEPGNLRWATKTQQSENRRIFSSNKSGTAGIFWSKTNKRWLAYFDKSKARKHIGSFKSKDEAIRARNNFIGEQDG